MPESGGPEVLQPDGTRFPEGSRCWGRCCEAGRRGLFRQKVEDAQRELERVHPELFVEPRRINLALEEVYTRLLAELLTARYGVCSVPGGPGDEVGVKDQNGESEQYDVVISDGKTWANQTVVCKPARF